MVILATRREGLVVKVRERIGEARRSGRKGERGGMVDGVSGWRIYLTQSWDMDKGSDGDVGERKDMV